MVETGERPLKFFGRRKGRPLSAARERLVETLLPRISVPVANEENKLLEEDIQSKTTLVLKLRAELTENEDRIYAIQEHMKNVRQEFQHTNALTQARGIESELCRFFRCSEILKFQETKRKLSSI